MTPAEGAKSTALYTHVREIDVAINYISDLLAHSALPKFVGHSYQPVQIAALGAKKNGTVLSGKLAAFTRLVEDRFGTHGTNPASSVRARARSRNGAAIQVGSAKYSGYAASRSRNSNPASLVTDRSAAICGHAISGLMKSRVTGEMPPQSLMPANK